MPSDHDRLRARIYTLLHRGNAGDQAFYARRAGGGDVLELGCGAGRISRPLAEAGARVVGVDHDPAMLELAREDLFPALSEAVRLVQADMAALSVDGCFDHVVIPYNALFALGDDDAIVGCLERARQRLRPGGRLIFDAYVASDELIEDASPEEHIATIIDEGARIDAFEWEEPAGLPCTFLMRYRYVVRRSGRITTLEDAIRHHYVPPHRVPALLERAGLSVEHLYGDFAGGALTDDSDHMVVIARLA